MCVVVSAGGTSKASACFGTAASSCSTAMLAPERIWEGPDGSPVDRSMGVMAYAVLAVIRALHPGDMMYSALDMLDMPETGCWLLPGLGRAGSDDLRPVVGIEPAATATAPENLSRGLMTLLPAAVQVGAEVGVMLAGSCAADGGGEEVGFSLLLRRMACLGCSCSSLLRGPGWGGCWEVCWFEKPCCCTSESSCCCGWDSSDCRCCGSDLTGWLLVGSLGSSWSLGECCCCCKSVEVLMAEGCRGVPAGSSTPACDVCDG